jgi:hypothetical protein
MKSVLEKPLLHVRVTYENGHVHDIQSRREWPEVKEYYRVGSYFDITPVGDTRNMQCVKSVEVLTNADHLMTQTFSGWYPTREPDGIIRWYHKDSKFVILATPDYDVPGFTPFEWTEVGEENESKHYGTYPTVLLAQYQLRLTMVIDHIEGND